MLMFRIFAFLLVQLNLLSERHLRTHVAAISWSKIICQLTAMLRKLIQIVKFNGQFDYITTL